jgi:hypothetical protein
MLAVLFEAGLVAICVSGAYRNFKSPGIGSKIVGILCLLLGLLAVAALVNGLTRLTTA